VRLPLAADGRRELGNSPPDGKKNRNHMRRGNISIPIDNALSSLSILLPLGLTEENSWQTSQSLALPIPTSADQRDGNYQRPRK